MYRRVILYGMEQKPETQHVIQLIKQRGWEDASRTVLDIIEPIAPLVSSILWVLQPASTVFGARKTIGDLASILDHPQGIDHLREQLDEK